LHATLSLLIKVPRLPNAWQQREPGSYSCRKQGFDNALITLQNPLWNKLAADDGGLRVFDVTNSYLPPQS
jgi:hypothetical protein